MVSLPSSLSAGLRRRLPNLLPAVLLFAALTLLRLQLVNDTGMTLGQAAGAGLLLGVHFDVVMVLLALAVGALLLALVSLPEAVGVGVAGTLVWLATLAHVLHFRFFGIALDWWIVEMHWRDLLVVRDSAVQLGMAWPVVVSAALLLAFLAATALRRWLAAPGDRGDSAAVGASSFWAERRRRLRSMLPLTAVGTVLWVAPGWFGRVAPGPLINDNVVHLWIKQNFGSKRAYAGAGTGWSAALDEGLSGDELAVPSRVLAAYRDLGRPADAVPPPAAGSDWPLYTSVRPDPAVSRKLRASLGLPLTGPVNVIYLFVESLRAWEFFDPELSRSVLPRLHDVLDEHAVFFTQAYSSSLAAGQTVRGQFSTQCSALPNMLGAAEYISHTTMRITCIAGFLKQHGYRTLWFNSYHSTYHGKRAFETLHGMDEFFDGDYFDARGITHQVGTWGLADGPVLQETLRVLVERADPKAPFYANVLTISTHHPCKVVPEGPLPPELRHLAKSHPEYAGYLSQLIYAGGALADFFEAFFASPLADNTLVVLLGDHSTPVLPPVALTPEQATELRFRIPLAFVAKNLPAPGRRGYPVHQVDVTPAVAAVLGLDGEAAWMGRNILTGPGSAWAYVVGGQTHYRAGERACYSRERKAGVSCYDVSGIDPLFEPPRRAVPADPEQTRFFERVARATLRAIALNLVEPPRSHDSAAIGSGSVAGSPRPAARAQSR